MTKYSLNIPAQVGGGTCEGCNKVSNESGYCCASCMYVSKHFDGMNKKRTGVEGQKHGAGCARTLTISSTAVKCGGCGTYLASGSDSFCCTECKDSNKANLTQQLHFNCTRRQAIYSEPERRVVTAVPIVGDYPWYNPAFLPLNFYNTVRYWF